MTIDRLHAFIKEHGFASWTRDGVIEIAIPARYPDGSMHDITERCEPTLAAVRRALGY